MNFHTNQTPSSTSSSLPAIPLTFVCLAVWLVGILVAADTIRKTPYFGAEFIRNGKEPGLMVKSVDNFGPADIAGLRTSDIVISIGTPGGSDQHLLSNVSGVHDRSEISTYEDWARAVEERPVIWKLVKSGAVELTTLDGKRLTIDLAESRNWTDLPSGFWIALVHSLCVLLISIGFISFAAGSSATGLLFVSGISLSVNILVHSFRNAEELVLSPEFWTPLYVTSNVSANVFAYALLAMLWHTPRPLLAIPFTPIALAFAVLTFPIQHFRWLEFPIHPFQFPHLLAITIAAILIVVKWVQSRGQPIDRATVSWVVLSIVAAVFPWTIGYSLPLIIGGDPLIKPNLASAMLTIAYVGFAFGAIRFRLFGMQTVWLWSLVWMAVGVGFVIVDLVLLTQFNWHQSQAAPTAIVLASWAFFPLKNLVLNHWSDRTSISTEEESLNLFDQLNSIQVLAEFDGNFIRVMKQLFQALEVDVMPNIEASGATIQQNGLALAMPAITKEDTIIFRGRSNGQRLFSNEDRAASENFVALARRIYEQKSAEFSMREIDRSQIVRDLHDDVGSKILNLIYATPEGSKQKQYADQALKALKDSMMTIENDEGVDIESNWQSFWDEQIARLELGGFKTEFSVNFEQTRIVGARDFVNMKRILEEHVSNILKYADFRTPVVATTRIAMNGDFSVEMFSGIVPDGDMTEATGRGTANMATRAQEAHAVIEAGPEKPGDKRFRLYVLLPLVKASEYSPNNLDQCPSK